MGKVLFVACTNVGKSMIDTIMNDPGIKSEICGIVNLNVTRGASKANYQTYADISDQYHIPLHYCDNVNDRITLDWIRDKEPDIILQTGWSQKFRDELLSIPRYGCIGEHPAPLPKGRGAACVNWAILTGETAWGDSFFEMVSEYDKGKLLAQEFFRIEEYDNVKTVYDKVAHASASIVKKYLDQWTSGNLDGKAQNDENSTYYKRRTPRDGLFTFEKPAKELHDFIRAQTFPYPGAFLVINGKKLKVLSSEIMHNVTSKDFPGTVIAKANGCVDVVCAGGSVLRIKRVQYDYEAETWAEAFIAQHGDRVFLNGLSKAPITE